MTTHRKLKFVFHCVWCVALFIVVAPMWLALLLVVLAAPRRFAPLLLWETP